MKIALLQLEVLEKNKAANVAHGLQLAADAAKEHDLLVLPEVWTTGYSLGHLEQDAEPQDSPVLAQLAELARSEQCAILAGSVPMRHADGKVYNTSAAINKNGEIVNLYDKVHLFGLFNEENFFAPGNNFQAFTLDGLCCGSTICYDLRFPELFRHLALQGAQLIFCPAEWPEARGDIWRLLAQARAALRVRRFTVIRWLLRPAARFLPKQVCRRRLFPAKSIWQMLREYAAGLML